MIKFGRLLHHAIVSIAILEVGISSACSCGHVGNIIERAKRSDLVFEGEMQSESIDRVNQEVYMVFKVKRILNESFYPRNTSITIVSALTSSGCGFQWPVNRNSIIFAYLLTPKPIDTYGSSMCSRNILEPSRIQLDSLWPVQMHLETKK
jgi:hypothetical protein